LKKKPRKEKTIRIDHKISDFFKPVQIVIPQVLKEVVHDIIPNIEQCPETFNLKGLIWNCRSARSKLRQEAIKSNIHEDFESKDIISLTETWLEEEAKINHKEFIKN
jgi:hypothetical protein